MEAGSPIGLLLALTYAIGGEPVPSVPQIVSVSIKSDANANSLNSDKQDNTLQSDSESVSIENEVTNGNI